MQSSTEMQSSTGSSTDDRGMRRAFSLLGVFVATSVVAGVLGAGLLMPAAGVTGSLARSGVQFFDSLPEELQITPLSQQSRILYADGTPMATFFYENRVSVPLSSVAPVLRQAVVAIEDSRFYEHGGADPKGILRAMVNNASGGDTQGASTLTQQWVKNVLLEQAIQKDDKQAQAALQNPNKGRKLREIKLAMSAEKKLSKDEILQNYLNIALFGDGQYGIETASRHFLGKSAADLTLPDAALMAGLLQSPSRYDPVDHPEAATVRRNVVLARMLELGMISKAQHDEAEAVPVASQLHVQNTQNGCEQAGGAGFFCSYVTNVMLNDPSFGKTENDRLRNLYRGGLTITTTLNPTMQQAATDVINQTVPAGDSSGVAGSIVSVEPGTGHILAMAQNRTFNPRADGTPGGTSINYNTSFAFGGSRGFQPGSTFKPFVLATWLKSGHSLSERVDARQKTFPNSVWQLCNGGHQTGKLYSPRNAGDGEGSGSMSVLEATYNSVNTAYAQMGSELSLCDIKDTALSLGIVNAETGDPIQVNPAMVLGSGEVAPLAMAGAYTAFADQGKFCKPTAIVSISDPEGKQLSVPSNDCTQPLPPDVANGVTAALENTLIRGTAAGNGISRPAAGKTGTTNESVATWFVGYTPQVSTAVWLGHPDSSASLNGSVIAGRRYGRMYGATLAAPIWNQYMTRVHDGLPVEDFAGASAQVQYGDRTAVPRVAGMTVDQAKARLSQAGFQYSVGGSMPSSVGQGRVAGTRPGSGTLATPGTTVTIITSTGPPRRRQAPAPAPAPAPAQTNQPAPPPTTPAGQNQGAGQQEGGQNQGAGQQPDNGQNNGGGNKKGDGQGNGKNKPPKNT
ncbi:MAG: penicillin-binding protein [Actinomycetes bacterium]